MCVLSIHNELPPINSRPEDAAAVAQGLALGEEATSATLRAVADCLVTLASMCDTCGCIMTAFKDFAGGASNGATMATTASDLQATLKSSLANLDSTVERANLAVQKYRALQEYAETARAAGRGAEFEAALLENGGEGFDTLVNRRVQAVRGLKIRVQTLKQLESYGSQLLATFDLPTYFLVFYQPIRDMAIAANDLYSEVLRGALINNRALNQVGRFAGEDVPLSAWVPETAGAR